MPTLGLPSVPPLPSWPTAGEVLILDLEYTAWEGSAQRRWREPWEWREIVEFGLALADGASFTVRERCELLVRPRRGPILSDYFVALTGITQARLDAEALPLRQALAALPGWARDAEMVISNGNDGEVLRENCALQGLPPPWAGSRMFDFRPLLSATLGVPAPELTSSELPRLATVAPAGRAHSALDDCLAIASSLAAWRASGTL